MESILVELQSLTTAEIKVRTSYLLMEEQAFESCCFIPEFNIILIILDEIEQIASDLEADEEEVFKYALLHEIGHSLDKEFSTIMSRLDSDNYNSITEEGFQVEVNAWKIADTLVGNQTPNYKLLRAWMLDGYADEDRDWVTKYCPDYF